jgi:PhnB protein
MKAIHPYLNFAGNTEEAFEFYRSVFGGELSIMRYRDMADDGGMSIPESDLDKIANVGLSLGNGTDLMGTDVLDSLGQSLSVGNNYSIVLDVESEEEGRRLFESLSAGGEIGMPFMRTEWAELFGDFKDRFGVQWMVNYTGDVA